MKKFLITSVLFISFAFLSTTFGQFQIQSGEFNVDTNTPGFTLDKNTGDRSVSIEVNFPKPFNTKPEVVLSVTKLDAATDKNIRYRIETMSVSRDGFTIRVRTWSESKIFGLSGAWIAHTVTD